MKPTPKKTTAKEEIKENSFPVVAIGSSAGGLEAMMEFLKYLPADTGMAFIYVQHLSPDHKSLLTEILSKKTKMIVQEIDDMDKIKPDNVFVIPYNKGIEVTDGHIKLIPRSETSMAITIDILFSSLAEAQKERVIGIILSGSASDGTMGMKTIKQEGGLTFAQDDTAKFTSMPHSAIAAGAVDFILSPKEIALELARLSKHPLIKTIGIKNGEEDLIDNSNPDLKIILNLLHKATGVDFSAYKMNTIKRRIIRRMLLYKITTLKEYAKMLSQKKEEIDILYQDLLINVTSFFRDTDTHQYLKETLFPKLLKRKKTGESLRIWIPACATGEEAYSIAMMLLEIQESITTTTHVQIFATDLSQQAISKARIGVYSKHDLETVSPKRIQRFFIKADGGFRVNKALRDMCVFAPHNVLSDPPFSRLDFISCCNLFIYFDTAAQKKAVNTFHYALNDDGFLMLGKSENISQSANLFMGFNKKYKIFSRKKKSGNRTLPALLPRYSQQNFSEKNIPVTSRNKTKQNILVSHNELDNAIDAVLVSEFMPPSVVINYQMEIVQFRGTTDLFLTHPKGKATFNILKMARPDIAFELRNAISKVIKTKHRVRKSGIELKIDAKVRIISLEIVPLNIESDEPLLLILFTEQEQIEMFSPQAEDGKNNSLAKDRRIKKLEQELAAAQADALSIAEDQEAYTEELQSANEEVVSSNEELQTVNEELETSKEEIESANEELITTNQELQTRNDLLNESYEYSEAVISTLHNPMIVLDKNLRVKSANKTFYKIFNVKEEDTEGVLLYDLGNKQWDIPRLRELLEDILPRNSHFHDFEIIHTFPVIGEKIMLLNARRIIQKMNHEELILLAISDVTEVRSKAIALQSKEKEILLLQIDAEKNLRKKIEDSEKRYNMMLMQSPFAFAVLKGKDRVLAMANDSIKEMWGKGNEIEGRPLIEVLPELKGQGFMELLDGVYTTGIPYIANEALAKVKRNGKMEDVYFNFVYQPYRETDDTISGVTIIAIEVTNEVIAKQKIKDSQQQLQNIFMQAPFSLNIYEGKELVISLANKLFCEIIGKTESEILGKKLFDVFPETATQGLDKILSDIFSTGIPFKENEFPVHFLKNGNEFKGYFDFIYQPIFDYNKNVSGVINVAIDVTDKVLARKKIEESEEHFCLMADLMPSKISNANADGDVTYFNKHWLDFSGYTFEELRDFGYHKIMHPDEMEEFQQRFQKAAETGTDLVMEMRFKNKQGDYIWHLNIASPIKDKNGIHKMWIGVTTEIHEQKTVAEKIKESEGRFRQLIQQAPVAICVIRGEKYVVQTVNAGMLEFWGRTKAQVLNKPIFEVLTELEGQGFEALVNGVYTTGQRFVGTELPVTLLRKGQLENAYVTFIYEPLREVDGTISGIMVLAHEITDQVNARKAIEVSEKKFRLLTNAMPQKISNADADGNVIFYNQRWLDDTGLTFEELKDWGWRKVMHPDEIENIVENWKYSVSTGDIFDIEMRIKNKAGEYRWNLSRAVPIRDEAGKILMWVGSNTDIHEQKEQKEALEQAVAERTLELSEANEELKKMNKELEAFAYVSSHDLQEPLRKIQTFAGRILEKENQNLSDSGKNYFRLMQNAAERMQTLIQDLLAFSHLSMADRKFETTDLNIIVEEVKKEFKDDIAEKNAVIEVEEICEVKIIPFQFRQLMHNLISNALKFSNPKIQPHIKISSVIVTYSKIKVANLPPRKEYCRIRISDNGIGFEKEFAEKIFEVFQKLHSKDEYPGTGIGLAIVKKIVDNHNGVITATSELNKGTTFDIYIPV